MTEYILDTNICIYIIKKKPVNVFNRFKELTPGTIGISSVTLAEMQYGVAKSVGAVLVTNNTKEFNRLSGLEIENWARD